MSSLSKEAMLVHAALEAKGLETPLRGLPWMLRPASSRLKST